MKIEPFKLERWMTTYETNVRYDIAESGISPMTARELLDLLPAEARDAALAGLLDLPLGYSEARGTEALRAEIANTYRDLSPDDILVTTGAIEANFVLLNTLLEPGDHVVAIDPAYQQLQSVPRAIGCDVSLWRLRPETGFRFDLDELERLVTP
ncbi:MAG TPA: aminotransferase class I/II-fold pyridoxal phosphate-dependent enzyme, partial [Thermomicrobiales bacterium]|nr:aminotransferase class I/II-fold pyridoxal phosphate-dependent enzyme [Thermomicrobiales bacterium]